MFARLGNSAGWTLRPAGKPNSIMVRVAPKVWMFRPMAGGWLFIEVKIPKPGQKTKFQTIAGVHQMVRQYIQGRILEKIIRQPFALATIGASDAESIEIPLNEQEQSLLRLVNEERQSLEVPDLPWDLLTTSG